MRLIMLSPPGAGKGTHSARLSRDTGITHISSGDLLRAEIARRTELGQHVAEYTRRGDLVPDDLIFDLLTPVVVAAVRDTGGYLLDGFPRTMSQALGAARIGIEFDVANNAVIYLTAPEEVLVERLLARARREGRTDDRPGVIRHRLDVFRRETLPLVEYYRGRGILLELDANRSESEIHADLRSRLAAAGVAEPHPTGIRPELSRAQASTAVEES